MVVGLDDSDCDGMLGNILCFGFFFDKFLELD